MNFVGKTSVALLLCIGWIANLVQLIQMDEGWTTYWFIKLVGLFLVPLGAILGYYDMIF